MQTAVKPTELKIRNILFATDFSPAAANALFFAGELARRFGAKLHAVNAAEPANYALPPQSWHAVDEARALETKRLQQSIQTFFPDVDHEVQVWEGVTGQVVPASIARANADLVVLGTHGRTGAGRLLLGSSAEEILRTVPCPVLTVGPQAHKHEGWQPTDILYATDFSPAAVPAAHYAVALAREYGASLTLLHVIQELGVGDLVHPSELIDSSTRLLRNLVPQAAGLRSEPRVEVEQGEPAEKILEAAKRVNANLIVLGARRSSGVPGAATHLPIATVHEVVANAPCPVLTVRHDHE